MPDPTELVDALASTVEATASLCANLSDAQWSLSTGCPGWTVKDVVAHLAGLEAVLSGEPEPDHELVGEFPHVRDDIGRYMETHVDARRSMTSDEVLAEFNEIWTARLAFLRALDDEGFQVDSPGPMGSTAPLARSLRIRVFDAWAHEQDIRRAIGRPGGLDTAAGTVSLATCKRFGPGAAASVVPEDGVVVFSLDGPNGGDFALCYSGGRATALDVVPGNPAVTLAMSDETFAYLCCGRSDAPPGKVEISGDTELGDLIVEHLGFTP